MAVEGCGDAHWAHARLWGERREKMARVRLAPRVAAAGLSLLLLMGTAGATDVCDVHNTALEGDFWDEMVRARGGVVGGKGGPGSAGAAYTSGRRPAECH